MPIDHTTLYVPVDKFEECLKVCLAALGAIGYEKKAQYGPTVVGIGIKGDGGPYEGHADFWLAGAEETPKYSVHMAFAAKDRSAVDAFHKAAIEAGGKDNGAPGLRPQYHENYYGAFFLDPAGNNLEAVYHLKPQ